MAVVAPTALLVVSTAVLAFFLLAALLTRPRPAASRRRLPLPPGPRGFPILGALPLLGEKPHAGLAALARRHRAPIMHLKLGFRDVVVASTASAASAFLKGASDSQFADRPSTAVSHEVTYGGNTMVFANYGPLLKLFRRVLNLHLLGPKALAGWSDVRRSELRHMLRSVHETSTSKEAVAVPEVLMFAAGNIIGQVMLSRRVFDAGTDEKLLRFKEMVTEMMTGVALFNVGDFVPWVAWMDLQGVQRRVTAAHRRYDALITSLLAEHAATAAARSGRPDLVDLIESSETALTAVNVKGLILDMFNAGTDTSTIVVEWAMAEMLRSPEILLRCQAELDAVVGRDRVVEEGDLPDLPYLIAVCKEALRKHPPTPLSIPHYSVEACEVAGEYRIPPETRLLVNIWAIGRDPEVWESPEEFRPERFLAGGRGAEMEPDGGDFELIPFGSGRRICAGRQAGMIFVQYFLAALVHAFDWEAAPEPGGGGSEIDMEEMPGIVLPKKVPLRAFATPRLSPRAYEAM